MKLLGGPFPAPGQGLCWGTWGAALLRLTGERGRRTDALPLSPGLSLVTVTCEIQGEGLSPGSMKQVGASGVLCCQS